jgi:hypothetical protein
VTASSRAGSAPAVLTGQSYRSDPVPEQSLQFHFATAIRVTHYQILADNSVPRSWVFEGHVKHQWIELDTRADVDPGRVNHVFEIGKPVEVQRLRFRLTGPNQEGAHGFELKYFEVWGTAGC